MKKSSLIPIARASPIWGFLVFFGLHNLFLPKERRRSLGCLGWLVGPLLNIYSWWLYSTQEGIYFVPNTGQIIVKNVTEVASLQDVWSLIGSQGGMLHTAVVPASEYGNVDTSGFIWTMATVEKAGSEDSTPEVIVAESGGRIRRKIAKLIVEFETAAAGAAYESEVAREAAFQDAVATARKVSSP